MPALKVFEAGKGERDLRRDVTSRAAAILFVHVLDRNVAPVLRGLDEIARARQLTGFVARHVFLSADRSEAEARLAAVNRSLRLHSPLMLSIDGAEGPGAFALEKDCSLALVLVKGGRVVRSEGFVDPGRQDVDRLRAWIAEIDGPLPKTLDEWERRLAPQMTQAAPQLRRELIAARLEAQRLRARLRKLQGELRRAQRQLERGGAGRAGMRGRNSGRNAGRPRAESAMRAAPRTGAPDSRPARRGTPPRDPQLQNLLRAFVRKTNDASECEKIYEAILWRAAQGEALAKQAKAMLELVTSAGYGAHRARELARAYVLGKRPSSRTRKQGAKKR